MEMTDHLKVLFEQKKYLELSKAACLDLLCIIDEVCTEHQLNYWIDGGTLLGSIRHKGFIPWDDDIDICIPYGDYQKLIPLLQQYCKTNERYTLFYHDTPIDFIFDYLGDTTYLIDSIFPLRVDLIPVKILPNHKDTLTINRSLSSIFSIYYQGKTKSPDDIIESHRVYLPKSGKPYLDQHTYFINEYRKFIVDWEKEAALLNPEDRFITYVFEDFSVIKTRPYYRYTDIFPLKRIEFENKEFFAPSNINTYLTILYGENYIVPPPIKEQKVHFNKIVKNKLSPPQTKQFLSDFYKTGIYNFGYHMSKSKQRLNRFKNSLLLIVKFGLAFRMKELKYVVSYIALKWQKKR